MLGSQIFKIAVPAYSSRQRWLFIFCKEMYTLFWKTNRNSVKNLCISKYSSRIAIRSASFQCPNLQFEPVLMCLYTISWTILYSTTNVSNTTGLPKNTTLLPPSRGILKKLFRGLLRLGQNLQLRILPHVKKDRVTRATIFIANASGKSPKKVSTIGCETSHADNTATSYRRRGALHLHILIEILPI